MWHWMLVGLVSIWIATIVGVVVLAVHYYVKESTAGAGRSEPSEQPRDGAPDRRTGSLSE